MRPDHLLPSPHSRYGQKHIPASRELEEEIDHGLQYLLRSFRAREYGIGIMEVARGGIELDKDSWRDL